MAKNFLNVHSLKKQIFLEFLLAELRFEDVMIISS